MKVFLRWCWRFFFGGLLAVFLLILSVALGLFGSLPSGDAIENPENDLATQILSVDEELLGTFFVENRIMATHPEIPQFMRDGLVATEDARFYDHAGIDFKALGRVLIKTVIGGQSTGGGSTISQQVAKNLFRIRKENKKGGKLRLVIHKMKEWVTAVKLERKYTKSELELMYLNTVTYLGGAEGIKSASKMYFSKGIMDLTIPEASTLVGMVKNPSLFNPKKRLEMTKIRRDVVMKQMVKYDYLPQAEYDTLNKLPLELAYTAPDHNTGVATHLREYIRKDVWENEIEPNLPKKQNGEDWNLYRDGLKIYTTINERMQIYAEEAVNEHLKAHQATFDKQWNRRKFKPWEYGNKKDPKFMERGMKNSGRYKRWREQKVSKEECEKRFANTKYDMTLFSWDGAIDTSMTPNDSIAYMSMFLQAGFMAVNPSDGQIKAWVGGIDHNFFKINHVKSKRQVGSTFKPIIYLNALMKGWDPCFKLSKSQVEFGPNYQYWKPRNSGGGKTAYVGMTTLKEGLAGSVNTIAARIMYDFCTGEVTDPRTPQPFVDLAYKLGIETEIPPLPSICLGTVDLSLEEMVTVYTSFANKGFRVDPYLIKRIEDKNGKVIFRQPIKTEQVIPEEKAYLLTQMMRGVVEKGTGQRLRREYNGSLGKTMNAGGLAGKTGTTQDNSDGWFIGFTPELVAGAWVGADVPSVRFLSTTYGQGAAMALPVFGKFMRKVMDDKSLGYNETKKFEKPSKELETDMDCEISSSISGGVGQNSDDQNEEENIGDQGDLEDPDFFNQ